MKLKDLNIKDFASNSFAGTITMDVWTPAPDGKIYQNFYCSNWFLIQDDYVSKTFRSKDGFSLLATDSNGNELLFVLGCRLSSMSFGKPIKSPTIYNLG